VENAHLYSIIIMGLLNHFFELKIKTITKMWDSLAALKLLVVTYFTMLLDVNCKIETFSNMKKKALKISL